MKKWGKVKEFPQNVANAEFEQRDCHGKLSNLQEKVIETHFPRSIGTLYHDNYYRESGRAFYVM